MEINKDLLGKLFEQAVTNPRLRQNYDLRTSTDDNSQRSLIALLPGTVMKTETRKSVFILTVITEEIKSKYSVKAVL